jgi:predicted phosphodiesterase
MSKVGIIGDTHFPCEIEGYLDWCYDVFTAWGIDEIVHIGDLVDNCALSFHKKSPVLKDPVREYEKAMVKIERLTSLFPTGQLLIGNHDALPWRLCDEVGIPHSLMRSPKEIWGLDGWDVTQRFGQIVIDDVIYQHGDRGRGSARLNMQQEMMSVVQGHHHSKWEISGAATTKKWTFNMQVGCGVDWKHMAMDYGVKFNTKPILGCGVVIDGHPYLERMVL